MISKRRSALLVEADPVQRDLLGLALRRLDMEVVSTSQGSQVQALIKKHQPAILVVDAFLPNTNGLDLLRELRDEGVLNGIGVIFISGLGFREIVQQAIEAGAHYFLVKPVDTDLFVQRVRQLLAEKRRPFPKTLSAGP